jgi:MSHA biogenesis protein MshK
MGKSSLLCLMVLMALPAAYARALQDPTRPTDPTLYFGGNNTRTTTADWTLQSVLSSPARRIAIINGTRVKEGDRIGSARVVSIQPSHVVLHTGSRNLTLHLWDNNIKKVTP